MAGTPYDLSTNRFTAGINDIVGLTFKPDGLTVFLFTDSVVTKHTLSTAWDLNTRGSAVQTYDFSAEILSNAFSGIFSADGTKFYVTQSYYVSQFGLSTAWDLSTTSLELEEQSPYTSGALRGLCFNTDGTLVYQLDVDGYIVTRSLTTPWDLTGTTTHVSDIQVYNLSGDPTYVGGLTFHPSGSPLYIVGGEPEGFNYVREYSLSTPWVINSTRTLISTTTLSDYGGTIVVDDEFSGSCPSWNADGTKFYVGIAYSLRDFAQYDVISTSLPVDPQSYTLTGQTVNTKKGSKLGASVSALLATGVSNWMFNTKVTDNVVMLETFETDPPGNLQWTPTTVKTVVSKSTSNVTEGFYSYKVDTTTAIGDFVFPDGPAPLPAALFALIPPMPDVGNYLTFDVTITALPSGGKLTFILQENEGSFNLVDSPKEVTATGRTQIAFDIAGSGSTATQFSIGIVAATFDGVNWPSAAGIGLHTYYLDNMRFADTPIVDTPMLADSRAYTITTQNAALRLGRKALADVTTYTITAAAGLKHGFKMAAESTGFTLTAQDIELSRFRRISADPHNMILDGSAALRRSLMLIVDSAAYAYTAQDVNLPKGFKVTATKESFLLTTEPSAVRADRNLPISVNDLVISGDVNLLRNAPMTADVAQYNLTAPANVLRRGFSVLAATASFVLSAGNVGTAQVAVPFWTFTFESFLPEYIGENIYVLFAMETTDFRITSGIGKHVNIFVPQNQFTLLSDTIDYYLYKVVGTTTGVVPLAHMEDSKKLEADAYIDLFEIVLSDNVSHLYLKMNHTVFWQGQSYEGTGIKIEGVGNYADDEVSRPKLTIWNPEGVFSALVDQGLLDNARIIRTRVLKEHIEQDVPISRRQQWRVKRVASVKKPMIALELRDMIDGQLFLSPGRMYIPPDFPMVNLQ